MEKGALPKAKSCSAAPDSFLSRDPSASVLTRRYVGPRSLSEDSWILYRHTPQTVHKRSFLPMLGGGLGFDRLAAALPKAGICGPLPLPDLCKDSTRVAAREAPNLDAIAFHAALLGVFLLGGAGASAALGAVLLPVVLNLPLFAYDLSLPGRARSLHTQMPQFQTDRDARAVMEAVWSRSLLSSTLGITLASSLLLVGVTFLRLVRLRTRKPPGGRSQQRDAAPPTMMRSGLVLAWRMWRGGKVEFMPSSAPEYEIRERGMSFTL